MDIGRRKFLKTVGYATSAIALRPDTGCAQSASSTCSIILDASAQTRWTEAMIGLLDGFLARSIPIAVIINPKPYAEHARPLPAHLLHALVRAPQLVELITWAEDSPDPRGYFQLRASSKAASAMQHVLALSEDEIPLRAYPVTLAFRQTDVPLGMNGVRSAGFRNVVLVPDGSGDTTDGGCPGPVTCASGGFRLSLTTDPDEIAATVTYEASKAQHFQVFLEPKNTSDASIGDLAAALAKKKSKLC